MFFALFAVLFFGIFAFTEVLMAATYIVSDLGGSTLIGIYATSFYGVGNALGIPLGRSFSSKIGTVRFLCICLIFFALFSMLCGVSTHFFEIVTFRFLQGLAAGPFYPLLNQLFTALTPPEKKDRFALITLLLFSNVPILGACWGGIIAYEYYWRWIFFLNIPFICLVTVYIWYRLKDYQPKITPYEFDSVGYIFYALGIFCISFATITGQEFDWLRSNMIVGMFIVGTVSFGFFILWSFYHPTPILNFALFKEPLFAYGIINLVLMFSAYFGMVILLSLWLTLYVNYSPTWVALLIGIMFVIGPIPAILLRKQFRCCDPRIPLAIALFFLALSSFHTMTFNVEVDMETVAWSRILAGLSLVLFLPPLFRLCFHPFKEEQGVDVVEMFQVARSLGSSLGVSLYLTLWVRRKAFYHTRLGGDLTAFSEQTKEYYERAKEVWITGKSADAHLGDLLDRQSFALALDEVFFVMAWISVGLIIFLILTYFFPNQSFIPEHSKKDIPQNDVVA